MTGYLDKQEFNIVFNDPDDSVLNSVASIYTGLAVEVRIGATDVNGLPPLTLANTLYAYGGLCSSISQTIEMDEIGSKSTTLVVNSPMSDLTSKSPYYTSQGFLDQTYPGDTSFVQSQDGSGQINLRWGKA